MVVSKAQSRAFWGWDTVTCYGERGSAGTIVYYEGMSGKMNCFKSGIEGDQAMLRFRWR